MRQVRVSAPGKLFLAGEHAVTEPGEPAVLVALDRRLELRLTSAVERTGLEREGRYVRSVVTVMDALARAAGRGTPPFAVHTRSTLVDPPVGDVPARKYGLGSSGAVTVAAVRALDRWYGLQLSGAQRLRAALLATLRVNPTASGSDVATSLTGGWVAYCAPDRDWVSARDGAETAVAELVSQEWPGLACAVLPTPGSLDLRVGWTGTPASTVSIVAAVRRVGIPPSFLTASREAADQLRTAVVNDDAEAALAAVGLARRALQQLGAAVGVAIETPLLATLADVAVAHGYAGKSSGAGGGDCGIALGRAAERHAAAALEADWSEHGITPLHVNVAEGAWLEEDG